MGYISLTYDGDWPAAGKHFERALALNPIYTRAHTFYPFYLSSLGRSEKALEVAKRALDLDPASPAVSHSLAVQLYLARKFEQAIEQAHDTLEMDANFAISYAVLGEAYLSKEMYREGLSALEKYSALTRNSSLSLALLGYGMLGQVSIRSRSRSSVRLRQLRSGVLYLHFSLHWFTPAWKTKTRPSLG